MGSCISSKKSIQKKESKKIEVIEEKSVSQMKNQVFINKIRNCPKLTLTDNEMYLQRKFLKIDKFEATIESRPATR